MTLDFTGTYLGLAMASTLILDSFPSFIACMSLQIRSTLVQHVSISHMLLFMEELQFKVEPLNIERSSMMRRLSPV